MHLVNQSCGAIVRSAGHVIRYQIRPTHHKVAGPILSSDPGYKLWLPACNIQSCTEGAEGGGGWDGGAISDTRQLWHNDMAEA